jgi:thioester reductase-like protein
MAETTHIIHCAWTVNFALPLPSFGNNLAGLQNLLALSLSTISGQQPANLVLCSSIPAAMGTLPPALIPSTPLEFSQASSTGYGRSKLVAEKIIERALKDSGVRAKVVRIGQIVPTRKDGANKLWNENEMIPLLIRSAHVIRALPDRLSSGDSCNWIEVDAVVSMISQVAGFSKERVNREREEKILYNVVHPKYFSWRDEFLPKLKESVMVFETVGCKEWLQNIRDSEYDLVKNPSRKLLGFWEAQKWSGYGEVKFDTSAVDETTNYWLSRTSLRVVDGDLVAELVEAWKKAW